MYVRQCVLVPTVPALISGCGTADRLQRRAAGDLPGRTDKRDPGQKTDLEQFCRENRLSLAGHSLASAVQHVATVQRLRGSDLRDRIQFLSLGALCGERHADESCRNTALRRSNSVLTGARPLWGGFRSLQRLDEHFRFFAQQSILQKQVGGTAGVVKFQLCMDRLNLRSISRWLHVAACV